jgi:hypothetical protein
MIHEARGVSTGARTWARIRSLMGDSAAGAEKAGAGRFCRVTDRGAGRRRAAFETCVTERYAAGRHTLQYTTIAIRVDRGRGQSVPVETRQGLRVVQYITRATTRCTS